VRAGDHPLRGVVMLLSSLLLVALLSALVKYVSEVRTLAEILFFRFAASLIPLAWVLKRSGGISLLVTRQPLQHALRSVFGILGIGLYFYALASIPIADATALSYSAPLFVMVLSIVFLGEKVGRVRWMVALLGFVGVFMIANPTGHGFGLGSLAAIGSALFGALVIVWIRRLSLMDPAVTIAVIYNTAGALVSLIWLLSSGWQPVLDFNLVIMMTIGIIAGFQQFLMTSSFRYAEASFLAPFEYSLLVFAAGIGWIFWGEVPGVNVVIGAVVISASGLIIVRRGECSGIIGRPLYV
jgi:drug/metabolite transporter (DMT)-like permease